jgi:hypothetical protein
MISVAMPRSKRIANLASVAGCVVALSLCAIAHPVQAKKPRHEKPYWDDTIIPGSQITVLELTRRILPDIKNDSGNPDTDKMVASDLSGVRLLDGVEQTFMELDLTSGDKCEIKDTDYFWMNDGGNRLLVLLLHVDVERDIIGLFKVAPEVTLLDAVTMAQDVHVDVEMEKLWQIHSLHQAFSVQCWHDNSSESYDNYTFVSIVADKLRAVAGPLMFTAFKTYLPNRKRLCKTAESPAFRFTPSTRGGYYGLVVSEETLKVCHRESEEWSWKTGVVYRRTVRRQWRWSAKSKAYRRVARRDAK